MDTFFTSDNHFYHTNIIKYSNRPYTSVEDMNERMIEEHNYTVKVSDTVYFLGDFSFSDERKSREVLRRLNGQKHLILGNHDKGIRANVKSFLGTGLFSTIQDYKEIRVDGQSIILFHYGCRVWNKSHHSSWLLYGHSHGSLPPFGKSVDVGVDAKFIHNEYRPTEFGEVKTFMSTREHEAVDHHGMD